MIGEPTTVLTSPQRLALIALARASIEAAVCGRRVDDPEPLELPDVSGVFVTIKRRGALRGCLGTLQNRYGLACEVVRCAIDSAREDPRFPPVSVEELPELALEISLLGPLEAIEASPDAFVIGMHGLVIEQGIRRGLLLPQVAMEWGWTPEQFLRHACIKAGLPPDAWRQGAQLYRFAAEVFGG
jgi:AmmeMemoRadiSam system protein A